MAAAACGHSPRAEPAPREMREPQPLPHDTEDPAAWQCPREGNESTIRAGAAPSPPSRLTAPQGDQGPARRDDCGKAGLWLLHLIDWCHVQEPKSLFVRKLHSEKKLLVASLSPPRRRAVRPWICWGSPPREAWRSFGSKEDTRLSCASLLPSSSCCGWVPALLGGKTKESSSLQEALSVRHLPRPVEARLICEVTLRICHVFSPTVSRLIHTDSEKVYQHAEVLFF